MTARADQRSLYERVFLYLSRRPGQRFAAYQLARALNVRIIMILDAIEILSEQGRVVTEPLTPELLGYVAVPMQPGQRLTQEHLASNQTDLTLRLRAMQRAREGNG